MVGPFRYGNSSIAPLGFRTLPMLEPEVLINFNMLRL